MSEELLQTIPQKIGKYTYYKLGSTTIKQLVSNGLIQKKDYKKIKIKKPDGIVLLNNSVKAVVEFKAPKELNSEKKIKKAINQEIEVASTLSRLLIVTDGNKSFWINALNGEKIKESDANIIKEVFNPGFVKNRNRIENLIDHIDASVTKNNSVIKKHRTIDPTSLATRLWQTIWVATGKSPVKCLYNVVELFVFKFLSDLEVLDKDFSFNKIYKKSLVDSDEALEYYARNTRQKIYNLFPRGSDGTTVINGTIFVNGDGEANLSQSILFSRSLNHLNEYAEEFGSLTKIDKQFKTKLYETFLKQEVEALGQYFTPRKIIQTIIRMAGLDDTSYQFKDKCICDPFCGVGGFLLEIINLNDKIKSCYKPKNDGKIDPPFTMHGFDKGFEREDERTIIMAKANMLIYLAEELFTYPNKTEEFAKEINRTFNLFRDNLGTFGHIIEDEDQKYDLILSNPPYVTSGSSIIKEEIQKTPRTKNEYPINALGLEGISLEWIIKSLKPGGKAFIVIPDGILARVTGKKLRNYILEECYLDAIISLPVRAFFANFKHTYILVITKKHDKSEIQREPVFGYLVSEIGEKMTSIKREEIEENDLPELETLFKFFVASKSEAKSVLEKHSNRTKVFDIQKFKEETHWVIDRWWSNEEKIKLGIKEGTKNIDRADLEDLLKSIESGIADLEKVRSNLIYLENQKTKEVKLGNENLFNLFIGKRIVKKELPKISGDIPVYSANVFEPFGSINYTNIENFEYPNIIWSIDGDFEFNYIPQQVKFATTDHCGTIQILTDAIDPEYLLYALNDKKREVSFDRSFRASLHNMRRFKVEVPVDENGNFNLEKQKKMADQFLKIENQKSAVNELKEQLDEYMPHFLDKL